MDITGYKCEVCEHKAKAKAESPMVEGDGFDREGNMIYDMWYCPSCFTKYEIQDDYEYCPNCGQHIDWSEFKDGEEN